MSVWLEINTELSPLHPSLMYKVRSLAVEELCIVVLHVAY